MSQYQAVKGVQDLLPPDVYTWQRVEAIARDVFSAYGFREARPPILEHTNVFTRGIGETSDIVEKEMYTFEDKGGRSLSLRPEGTASIVRAFVQHNLDRNDPPPQKYFYTGPMFRYERPQKGRFRQFHQVGVEAFGVSEPVIDAEVISMLMVFLDRVGLQELNCEINSLGCPKCRPNYREALLEFFKPKLEGLCPDCQRRYDKNPLRILDCKVPRCKEAREGAPAMNAHLCGDCDNHFIELKRLLELMKVPYTINPEMVRGLDYYTRTAFEVTSQNLGSQSAVAAGGRYDNLVKEFGGPQTPAIGFAIGLERLVSLVKESVAPVPRVFIASIESEAADRALELATELRASGLWVEMSYQGGSLKSQIKRANRFGADYVFIIAPEEMAKGALTYKRLSDGTSGEIPFADVTDFLNKTSA